MAITAQMVKDLRQKSGAGIMECKEALKETDGDIDASIEHLRKKGTVKAAKKADRSTKEGAIAGLVEGSSASFVEVKCETDFVARNDQFLSFVASVAKHQLTTAAPEADDEAFLAQSMDEGKTVQDAVTAAIHGLGENIILGRRVRYSVTSGGYGLYIHTTGNLGVLVELTTEKPETAQADRFGELAKDIAMHIVATAPLAVSSADIPEEIIAKEREIFEIQAKESGKPEKIIPKIVEGRVKKFFSESCLLQQAFVKNPDSTIAQLLELVGKELGDTITISRFCRLQLGE